MITRQIDLRSYVEPGYWTSVNTPVRIFWWLTVRVNIKLRDKPTAKLPRGYGD